MHNVAALSASTARPDRLSVRYNSGLSAWYATLFLRLVRCSTAGPCRFEPQCRHHPCSLALFRLSLAEALEAQRKMIFYLCFTPRLHHASTHSRKRTTHLLCIQAFPGLSMALHYRCRHI
ncbi:hypothetical protein BAUCODRAFT_36457 [Baudoinia panamericana UAMH 10762]|uniref:Uncharacterized protein n=1 Tax=Baudoinia panamericana (strain UAMH 10762) TaxID=717646 RepID=M2N5E6_BAUPA|nr:uncharacterized protein BAUCODRAFT_36457 [Baudoinia panamericana UAMH 10762]EMC93985.1 hypothetical protein BAUCODRAFT_36457 [Baudoinia panamericana UAMH 10762]